MNTILWIIQILLSILFIYSGICKATLPVAKLISLNQTGIDGLPIPLIRFIGITEIIGVIGLILPIALDILPALTPIAACCFAAIMVMAAPIHFKRKEYQSTTLNLIALALCIFLAIGRSNLLF